MKEKEQKRQQANGKRDSEQTQRKIEKNSLKQSNQILAIL
jgi:hypothetical protein